MPSTGLIRPKQIEADQSAGKMPKRKAIASDYVMRRSLMLPAQAQYDSIMALPKNVDLGSKLNAAMKARRRRTHGPSSHSLCCDGVGINF